MPETVLDTLDLLEQRHPDGPQWHVLWTRSQCEQLAYDQLTARGFFLWLPKLAIWTRRGGIRRRAEVPLFPGYVFLHHAMDKAAYLEVRKTTGIVRVLGDRWNRLAIVPDEEIRTVQTVLGTELPAMPHPYLREGQRVRIRSGPLADVEGILVRSKPNKGLLVVSIHLVQRSVAVEVDSTLVVAA